MASTLKDTDLLPSDISPTRPVSSGSPQTVALEVPVTVNGVRAAESSDKREPFAEATKTVLVHSAGAVIRLASSVVPGQLLFLTNDKTKKEVVCQVVKSKSQGNVSGYVELEFTEPVQGFWGLGFSAERNAASPAGTRPAVLAPLGQNMDSRPPVSSILAKSGDASNATPADEFKAEIKQDSRPMSKADFLAPADTTTQALKIETGRLHEQLSSLLFTDPTADDASRAAVTPASSQRTLSDATAKIFELAANEPAPRKKEPNPSDGPSQIPASKAPAIPFDGEEVKIPAWLEPLARNAAIPAPPEPTSHSTASEFEGLKASEPQTSAPGASTRSTGTPARPAASAGHAAAPATPIFGETLLGTTTGGPAKTSRGNKGILITAIAAGIVLATVGISWYLRQSSMAGSNASAKNSSPLITPAATLPAAPANSAPSSKAFSVTPESSTTETKLKVSASDSDRASSSSSSTAKLQPAAISERVSKSSADVDASKTPDSSDETEEAESKRPSLGKVRLGKPKVGHIAHGAVSGDAAPTLEANSEQVPAGELPLSGALLEGSANQPAAPAAPVPVGGDVVTARLLSSVPPAYPALARTQHIAGDVRVDALIDANGRVSAMKVVSGPTLLQQSAMDALRQWKYRPATLDGKPVSMHLTVTIQFRLQ
jgi:TonB family protein